VVVIRDGVMTSWTQPAPTQRQVVVSFGTTGAVQVYVFAHSADGFGPVGTPIAVRP